MEKKDFFLHTCKIQLVKIAEQQQRQHPPPFIFSRLWQDSKEEDSSYKLPVIVGFGTNEESEKATYLGLNIIYLHFPNYKPASKNFSVFNNGTCIGDRIYL